MCLSCGPNLKRKEKLSSTTSKKGGHVNPNRTQPRAGGGKSPKKLRFHYYSTRFNNPVYRQGRKANLHTHGIIYWSMGVGWSANNQESPNKGKEIPLHK